MINAVVGLQYGDEGKAKIFHSLLESAEQKEKYAIRWNGGPNAGHTVWKNGTKCVFHQVPSGVIVDDCISIIARGCAFDPDQYEREMKEFGGECLIDKKCPVILPMFVEQDKMYYQSGIGTTAKGIGPTFSSFIARDAVLTEDLLDRERTLQKLKRLNYNLRIGKEGDMETLATKLHLFARRNSDRFIDAKRFIHRLLKNHEDKYISFEGSQGYSLDPFLGDYPFVTSSGTNVSYLMWSLGISRKTPIEVIGVMKPYVTYVGTRDWPDEFDQETSERIRELGAEYGATTGRPRRIGKVNFDELNEALVANGVDKIALTKVDLMQSAIGEDLEMFESLVFQKTNTQVHIVSNGPGSEDWYQYTDEEVNLSFIFN